LTIHPFWQAGADPVSPVDSARSLSGAKLASAFRGARSQTRDWTFDLSDAQWRMPQQPGVNLVAWELAHLAWFAEFWLLRGPHVVDGDSRVHASRPARISGPDALFDSARIAHGDRWAAALPTRPEIDALLATQLDACIEAIDRVGSDDDALYLHRLVLFHEDMHGEAFAWMRAALGYSVPAGAALPVVISRSPIAIKSVELRIGQPLGGPGFAFDNELPGRTLSLSGFEIDAAPVTAGQFLRFVEAGGYDQPQFWPGDAGLWRSAQTVSHPARWRRHSTQKSIPAGEANDAALQPETGWETRWFDRWLPLDPLQPVIHVNAWESAAFAAWAGRRLPTAPEWEAAATAHPIPGSRTGFTWGRSVWEWTASAFDPYPGFSPGPYRDYSAPWFGTHRELRGGAFVTHARLHDPSYRNFFLPGRNDVFAGFRTAMS
jgi:iron(II)-dependent oxidoreductase